jgi:hypothetical protein
MHPKRLFLRTQKTRRPGYWRSTGIALWFQCNHLASYDHLRQRRNDIRIVVLRHQLVRSEISNLVPGRTSARNQFLLQREASMTRGNANVHDWFLSSSLAEPGGGVLIGEHQRPFVPDPAGWNRYVTIA